MSTTTMHFGPEWMRTKHQPLSRSQHPPSPPPTSNLSNVTALASLITQTHSDKDHEVHPFRYSKDELLRIYQEGGGKGVLGSEVERWVGVVREVGEDPITLREISEAEKKLFAGPLNSELRRRPSQSTEFLSPLTTSNLGSSRLMQNPSASGNSPLRERFGALKRRDSAANMPDTAIAPSIPRKPSLSTLQTAGMSPRDSSPRTRVGYTSNFDGVLNTGDSWTARRRASELPSKSGTNLERDLEDINVVKQSDIREEAEEIPHYDLVDDGKRIYPSSASTSHINPADANIGATIVTNGSNAPSLGVSNNPEINTTGGNDVGPPPGLIDPNAVEWSYKDPSGQIQGPFRADIMQRWYDEGYFSLDLPMKRTHLDLHWLTVEQLIKRATSSQIFLSPLVPVSAIPKAPEPANHTLHTSQLPEQQYAGPYQPAPIRSLRTTTLESYLTSTGSLPTDSPASSFAASFGNHSPDPQAHNSKAYGHPDPNGGRLTSLQGSSMFPVYSPEKDMGVNGYMYGANPLTHDNWLAPVNSPFAGGIREATADRLYPTDRIVNLEQASGVMPVTGSPAFQPNPLYGQGNYFAPQNSYAAPPTQPHPHLIPDHAQPSAYFNYRGMTPDAHPTQLSNIPTSDIGQIPPQSSWSTLPDQRSPQLAPLTIPQIGQAAMQPQLLPQSPWGRVDVPQSTSDHVFSTQLRSPTSAHATLDGPWPALQHVNESIPVAHPPQETGIDNTTDLSSLDINSDEGKASSPSVSPVPAAESGLAPQSISTKPVAKQNLVQAEAVAPPPPKSAWAIEEESQKRRPGASLSLREIQDAEARKAETKKAAEREKERLARLASGIDSKEDTQPFVTSWGLPTSQAGARTSSATPKESSSTAATLTSHAAPVWTTPVKQPATKKSMKEILEEEEKRKKVAKEVAVVPKRGYAETSTKAPTTAAAAATPASTSTVAWTTVGANGKASAPAPIPTPTPTRPAPPSATPSFSAATASVRPAAAAPPRLTPSASKPRPFAPKDEAPYTPSHEFLKWLTDSLKGLNSSVNVEEILAMLLSFPLDPDPTTVEIISDTIYSNSTTLNGRRFATEFVAKRKADAAARSQALAVGGKAAPKTVSIADVVKAAPKPTQPEWGFKVVNKKKKGGRS